MNRVVEHQPIDYVLPPILDHLFIGGVDQSSMPRSKRVLNTPQLAAIVLGIHGHKCVMYRSVEILPEFTDSSDLFIIPLYLINRRSPLPPPPRPQPLKIPQ